MYFNEYEQAKNSEGNYQWYGIGNGIYHKFGAFNTDVCLWKNISVVTNAADKDYGKVLEDSGCLDKDNNVRLHACPDNPVTKDYFKELANTGSSELLFEDFRKAFLKMLKAGLKIDKTTTEFTETTEFTTDPTIISTDPMTTITTNPIITSNSESGSIISTYNFSLLYAAFQIFLNF